MGFDAVGGDQDELHDASFRLAEGFRQKVEATRLPVPGRAHPEAPSDYLFNWLHPGRRPSTLRLR